MCSACFSEKSNVSWSPASRAVAVVGVADGLDDVVDVVERMQSAFEDVCPLFCLVEFELAAPPDDVTAVVQVVLEQFLQRQDSRLAVDQREVDDAEGGFEAVFEQLVLDDLRIAFCLSSTTTRMPSRSDSSRRSRMPSMVPSFTWSAMRSMSRALFVWNGSSVMTMRSSLSPRIRRGRGGDPGRFCTPDGWRSGRRCSRRSGSPVP